MDYKQQLNFNYEAFGIKPSEGGPQQIETPTYGSLRFKTQDFF